MASKFQNRLAGTIILVSVCVIFLPGLLDGKKKHYQERFAAIPLVPKAGDMVDNEQLPPVTQPLANDRIQQQPLKSGTDPLNSAITTSADSSTVRQSLPALQENKPAQANPASPNTSAASTLKKSEERRPADKAIKSVIKQSSAQYEQEQWRAMALLNGKLSASNRSSVPDSKSSSVAKGQKWVLQLAVLNNAARVNQIVQKLQAAGIPAFSKPAVPVAGKTNFVLVGPDASKDNLDSQRDKIKTKFKLDGFIRSYPLH